MEIMLDFCLGLNQLKTVLINLFIIIIHRMMI